MKQKTSKKNYSFSVGHIIIGLIVIIGIIWGIVYIVNKKNNTSSLKDIYQTNNDVFSDSQLKEIKKNEDHKNKKKISKKDLNIGEIYCGMELKDMISVLGESSQIYEEETYKSYRYNNYNMVVNVNNDTQKIEEISYYGNEWENKRGIKIGSKLSKIISSYHSEKNIGVYENNKGKYNVLYNSDDVFDYLYNEESKDKSLGYIFEYEDEVYEVVYVENKSILKFDILNGQVSHITMIYK